VAAFFDVDNTIIRGASAFHIARGLHARGYFKTSDIARFAIDQMRYVMFGESKEQIDRIRDKGLSIIRGWSVAEMATIGEEIYDEVLALRIFAGTKAILDRHLAAGHEVWLVTASPVEIGRIIARRLGCTGALGTVAERSRGLYTGALVGPLLHGEKKAEAARALAEERGIDLGASYAYGDSLNDTFILESVGNPTAINPEPRLRKHAKKAGWPIQDFRGKNGDGRRSIMQKTATGTVWVLLTVFRGLKRALRALFPRGT